MDYKFLPVSSAFVAPSLVLMGSTAVVGGFSSILSLSTGTLNIHSWANASTSESGWICFSSKTFPSYTHQNVLKEFFHLTHTSVMLVSTSTYWRPFWMIPISAPGGMSVPLMLDWWTWLSWPNVNAEWWNPSSAEHIMYITTYYPLTRF